MIEQLKKRIDELMTDNEVVMANAVKISANSTGNAERCVKVYSQAKNENKTYQNVMEIIKELENGTEN